MLPRPLRARAPLLGVFERRQPYRQAALLEEAVCDVLLLPSRSGA